MANKVLRLTEWEKIHLVEDYEREIIEQGFYWYMDEVNECGPCVGMSDLNARHHWQERQNLIGEELDIEDYVKAIYKARDEFGKTCHPDQWMAYRRKIDDEERDWVIPVPTPPSWPR
jgi:hypothetical protein